MYRNAAGTQTTTASNGNTDSANSTTKPCRYGINCSRIDCHFVHPEIRKSPIINSTSSTSVKSNMWFPLNFSMEIDENDELQISNTNTDIPPSPVKLQHKNNSNEKLSEKDPETERLEFEEKKLQSEMEDIMKIIDEKPEVQAKVKKDYKLSAVVCQIDDGSQKNLVSLVHVPGSYHEMKLGNNENLNGGWYIFNDFRLVEFLN